MSKSSLFGFVDPCCLCDFPFVFPISPGGIDGPVIGEGGFLEYD